MRLIGGAQNLSEASDVRERHRAFRGDTRATCTAALSGKTGWRDGTTWSGAR